MKVQPFAATLAVAMLLAVANAARANIVVSAFTAASNAPGTSIVEYVTSSALVTNTGTQAASVTLDVGDVFNVLTAAPTLQLESEITLDVVSASARNAASFISCIAPNSVAPNCAPGTIDTPALTPSITAVGPLTVTNEVLVSALLAPYALSHQLVLTLGVGGIVEFTATTRVLPASTVPEPASSALLIAALLAVTLAGTARGRRRNRVA